MNTILRKQFLAHVGQTSPEPMMIEVARAEGVFFYTPEGKRYYDLVAGVSVSNVGHANPRVVEAVQRQAADYMHIMVYGEMIERPQVRYAARIAELLPGELSSVYFVNSGAEAIEGALKLAKRYTHRTELVSMRRAYHGSTQGAMSLMGEPEGEEWKGAFRPLLPDVRAIDFNDFDQLRLITRRTACVVVEPVQGEAGVRPPVPGWLEALRRRCDEVGALLVFDEIQTGMGRTGEMFAMCKYGVTPDIVCLAKAFGGGMPLGAFAARKQIMDSLQTNPVLGHITTFGGHPVCCAAGLAALEYLLETGTVEHIESRGALYESLLADHPQVVEIRRSGLLLAVELGSSAKMFRMMELFKEAGILSDWFLYCDTAFRISPPLTITEEEVRDSASTESDGELSAALQRNKQYSTEIPGAANLRRGFRLEGFRCFSKTLLLRHRPASYGRIVVGIGESVGPNPMGQIVFHRHILPYILLLITRIVRSRRILLRSCENTAVRPVVKYNFNPMHYIQIR